MDVPKFLVRNIRTVRGGQGRSVKLVFAVSCDQVIIWAKYKYKMQSTKCSRVLKSLKCLTFSFHMVQNLSTGSRTDLHVATCPWQSLNQTFSRSALAYKSWNKVTDGQIRSKSGRNSVKFLKIGKIGTRTRWIVFDEHVLERSVPRFDINPFQIRFWTEKFRWD